MTLQTIKHIGDYMTMTFTNAQTALVYEWVECAVYIKGIYEEAKIYDDFEKTLAEEANSAWRSIHPEFKDLQEAFFPVFWDEVAQAFTKKFRVDWQKSKEVLTRTM